MADPRSRAAVLACAAIIAALPATAQARRHQIVDLNEISRSPEHESHQLNVEPVSARPWRRSYRHRVRRHRHHHEAKLAARLNLVRPLSGRKFIPLPRTRPRDAPAELRLAQTGVPAGADLLGLAALEVVEPKPLPVIGPVLDSISEAGNLFRRYLESRIMAAGPHVRLTCADGKQFPDQLRAVLARAAHDFEAQVDVLSGYRPLSYNRAIYGNRKGRKGRYAGDGSQHIRCRAADIRIAGVPAAQLYAWALKQRELGGVGRYGGDFIHVDIRPRPHGRLVTWDWRGGRRYARRHQRSA